MASDSVVRDMFRSLEATIHERLSMIADVISMSKGRPDETEGVSAKLTTVLEAIQTIDVRLTNLEMKKAESAETVHVNHIGKLSPDIWTVSAMPGLEINLNEPAKDDTISVIEGDDEMVEEEEEEVEEVEEEVEEEEEEGESVEQFTYKNKTYYRDSSNQVYGEPDETVIGMWDEARQRILFKRV
jgi:hypothetical protein